MKEGRKTNEKRNKEEYEEEILKVKKKKYIYIKIDKKNRKGNYTYLKIIGNFFLLWFEMWVLNNQQCFDGFFV